jgi:hypothetical protein
VLQIHARDRVEYELLFRCRGGEHAGECTSSLSQTLRGDCVLGPIDQALNNPKGSTGLSIQRTGRTVPQFAGRSLTRRRIEKLYSIDASDPGYDFKGPPLQLGALSQRLSSFAS